MPYKLTDDKRGVQVYKDGRWKVLKHYGGSNAKKRAKAYLDALRANVKEAA